MLVVYQFLRTQFKHELGLDFFFFKRLEYLVCSAVVPLFLYFVRFYYDLPRNRFVKWWDRALLLPVIGLCVCMVFVLLVDSVVSWDLMFRSGVDIILWPILILNGLGILVYRMIRKDRNAFFMMLGFLFGLSGLFVDILSNRLVLNLPRISTYGFIIFIMTMAIILANRYVQLQKEVEARNIKLERKLGYQDLKLEGLNIDKITGELSILMKEKKLFIDENLKLGDLANELSITSHQLSRLLNGHYNMNFNEFVNSYRVEEAKSKLISDKEKTILAIAFDVGFNTKATFNSQFLKFTRMTPSRYRRRYL
jgi:AraC-like DNA-binding protein